MSLKICHHKMITVEKSVDNQSVKFSSASFLQLTKLYSLSPNLHYLDRSCLELTKVGKMPHFDISQNVWEVSLAHFQWVFFSGQKHFWWTCSTYFPKFSKDTTVQWMVPYVEGLTEEEANSIGDSLRDLIHIPHICHFFYTGKIFGE